MRVYACPEISEDGSLTTVNELKVKRHLQHLYSHLLENNFIKNLGTVNHEHLSIHADVVLKKIREGDSSWQTLVPPDVVNIINERGLFKSPNDRTA